MQDIAERFITKEDETQLLNNKKEFLFGITQNVKDAYVLQGQ